MKTTLNKEILKIPENKMSFRHPRIYYKKPHQNLISKIQRRASTIWHPHEHSPYSYPINEDVVMFCFQFGLKRCPDITDYKWTNINLPDYQYIYNWRYEPIDVSLPFPNVYSFFLPYVQWLQHIPYIRLIYNWHMIWLKRSFLTRWYTTFVHYCCLYLCLCYTLLCRVWNIAFCLCIFMLAVGWVDTTSHMNVRLPWALNM